MNRPRRPPAIALLIVAGLCVLAYLPALSIPLMEDDYPNLWEAHSYGPLSALPVLLHNAVFRLRATSYWVMWPMWRAFGVTPWPYHLVSLLLHVANAWLVLGIVAAWARSPGFSKSPEQAGGVAFWTAAFFAVAEGHQEAVMWFSAINELLMFFFGAAALLCWLLARRPGGGRGWWAASWVLFAFGLLSKESGVIFLPLMLLTACGGWKDLKRALWQALPYVVLCLAAIASVLASRDVSFRFSDGSFSLHAPFWRTWPLGIWRALWIWGLLALAGVFRFRDRGFRRPAWLALAWIGIALTPYSFLTYSRQIPSRQTYAASFGLALLVGLAMAGLLAQGRRSTAPRMWSRAAVALAAVMLLQNVGRLWVGKRAQFLARAEPTEQLIRLAKATRGPIWVQCFPRVPYIAEEAVHMAAGRPPSTLIWSASEAAARKPAAVFCYHER